MSADIPQENIDDWKLEHSMSEITGNDIRILVKQVYTDENGHADPKKFDHFFFISLSICHFTFNRSLDYNFLLVIGVQIFKIYKM